MNSMELALISGGTSKLYTGILSLSQQLGMPLQVTALIFVGQIVASAQSQSQDG